MEYHLPLKWGGGTDNQLREDSHTMILLKSVEIAWILSRKVDSFD